MPMQEFRFEDDQFPFLGVKETRHIARAIVFDDELRVALHTIRRFDLGMPFEQVYFETPGGGIDEGETPEQAARRECEEELGFDIEVLAPLGMVDDYYNVICRHNINYYFIAKRRQEVGIHFVSSGDSLIQETHYYPIDEAIALMEGQDPAFISGLVRQRELPILRLAKQYLTQLEGK